MELIITLLMGSFVLKLLIRLFPFILRIGLFVLKTLLIGGIIITIGIIIMMGYS